MNFLLRRSLRRGSLVSWRHTVPMRTQNIRTHQKQRMSMSVRAVRRLLPLLAPVRPARLKSLRDSLPTVPLTCRRNGGRAADTIPEDQSFTLCCTHSLKSSPVRIWASKTLWRSFRPTARSQRRTRRWQSTLYSTRFRRQWPQATKSAFQALEASSAACAAPGKVVTQPQGSPCSSRKAPHPLSRQGRHSRTSSKSDMSRSRRPRLGRLNTYHYTVSFVVISPPRPCHARLSLHPA